MTTFEFRLKVFGSENLSRKFRDFRAATGNDSSSGLSCTDFVTIQAINDQHRGVADKVKHNKVIAVEMLLSTSIN